MSIESFTSKKYTHIIIGGGTAGLALAARLSEDSTLSIAVLEAGGNRLNDPLVDIPGLYGQSFGSPQHDWSFLTVPQKHLGNSVHRWPRGKMLGGSSGINLMMMSQCSARDLDNWVELGNPGWGWADLVPYFQRSETFVKPSEALQEKLAHVPVDPLLRGTDGPIQVGFCESVGTWAQMMWPELGKRMGYPDPKDCRMGTSVGIFNQPLGIDPKTGTRSYSARAYYEPAKDQPNLSVLTGALVEKIVFGSDNAGSELTATGVQFLYEGETYSIEAGKEVILCAGSIQSPQILELSGVGSDEVLQKNGIETLIDLAAVGENLRDHIAVPFSWEVKEGVPTSEAAANPAVFAKLMELYKGTKGGPLANTVTTTGFLPYYTLATSSSPAEIETHIKNINPTSTSPLDNLAALQLLDKSEAAIQVLLVLKGVDTSKMDTPRTGWGHSFPGAYSTAVACTTRTFSRGSIHITSADPSSPPAIDPAYLSHPLDVDVLAHAILHFQDMAAADPLSSFLKKDGDGHNVPIPGMTAPKTLEEAKEHVHKHAFTEYHPIGTCSMLPRESGGVVDAALKVYGTTNVRVCDASIFPLHVQGNIQSLVYAVAEKAADMLKAGQ